MWKLAAATLSTDAYLDSNLIPQDALTKEASRLFLNPKLNASSDSIGIIIGFDNIAKSTTWWSESGVNSEFEVIEAL